MRIGIITYWESQDNYGQLLQCYALQSYLRKIGHEPFLIRYHEDNIKPTGFRFSKVGTYLRNFSAYINYLRQKRSNRKYAQINNRNIRDFDGFRKKYLTVSDKIFTAEELIDNPPFADAYICGSDQIWGGSIIYYLSFVPQGKIKIAYAPSFGGTNPFAGSKSSEIKHLLSDFKFIGVREESGVQLLQNNGFESATQVVDPTLLLSDEDYNITKDENFVNSGKAFIYLLGNQTECSIDEIIKYVNSLGLNATYVASQGRVDKYGKSALTIPQWVKSISDSELIITNSFHCVVFSLIFHRRFVFVPLAGSYARMNDRLYDLLGKCGLSHRIYDGDFQRMSLPVDFSEFDQFKASQLCRINNLFSKLLPNGLK